MPLNVKLSTAASKYLVNLDKNTRRRITDKLKAIADDPLDNRLSYPLQGTHKRASRVGSYRILFIVEKETLIVADIGPRGQIYKEI